MWSNPQKTADLVIFTEETLMENLIFWVALGRKKHVHTIPVHLHTNLIKKYKI